MISIYINWYLWTSTHFKLSHRDLRQAIPSSRRWNRWNRELFRTTELSSLNRRFNMFTIIQNYKCCWTLIQKSGDWTIRKNIPDSIHPNSNLLNQVPYQLELRLTYLQTAINGKKNSIIFIETMIYISRIQNKLPENASKFS